MSRFRKTCPVVVRQFPGRFGLVVKGFAVAHLESEVLRFFFGGIGEGLLHLGKQAFSVADFRFNQAVLKGVKELTQFEVVDANFRFEVDGSK